MAMHQAGLNRKLCTINVHPSGDCSVIACAVLPLAAVSAHQDGKCCQCYAVRCFRLTHPLEAHFHQRTSCCLQDNASTKNSPESAYLGSHALGATKGIHVTL
eukprot:850523-Amphidinium_carterae.1